MHNPHCVTDRGSHCGACHITFGTLDLFDAHRVGHVSARRCVTPGLDGFLRIPKWAEDVHARRIRLILGEDRVWRTPEGDAKNRELSARFKKANLARADRARSSEEASGVGQDVDGS